MYYKLMNLSYVIDLLMPLEWATHHSIAESTQISHFENSNTDSSEYSPRHDFDYAPPLLNRYQPI